MTNFTSAAKRRAVNQVLFKSSLLTLIKIQMKNLRRF